MDLEALTKSSDFVFDSIDRMYYKCHRMSVSHAGQYIDSSDCIKNKKVTINQNNNNNDNNNNNNKKTCFKFTVAAEVKHQNSERMSKIKPFINNLNWTESFSSHKKDE